MQKKIVLTNDFHHTEVNLIPGDGELSPSQIRRAEKALCGISGCKCSNEAGMRGHGGDNDRITIDYDNMGMSAKPFAHVSK